MPRRVRAAERGLQALATRDGLAGWWTTDTQGDSSVGCVLRCRFHAKGVEVGGFDIKVLALQPATQVLAGISGGWPKVLSNLKTLLETGRALPRSASASH
jgi:uncharacterized protein YndB with AHSA1/START domain